MTQRKLLGMCAALCLLGGAQLQAAETAPYQPTWESLAGHQPAPEWLKDAKLGIYFHWGVYSVPAYRTEWYPRWMFYDSAIFTNFNCSDVFKHHVETYGHPSKFGYHDLVPMFTGEHFNPEEWADLFVKTGAKFAGPVAEHHDGFAMWASKITPWNAKDRGPHRDVVGEMLAALKKREMKTITTFHHERNLQRYKETWKQELEKWAQKSPRKSFPNSHFPYIPGMPTASEDPELRMLYGNMPEAEWLEKMWLGKLVEVIDAYQPDIIWFDSWLDCIPENYRQRFCAYYLNAAAKWNKEVAIVRKQDDLPIGFTVNDHEKSREPNIQPALWMSDDTVSTDSWSYTADMKIKPVADVLYSLLDIVSKNGVLLLNISPKADGTIPDDQRQLMLGLGAWLKKNGEAVYSTRPWIIAAEGPTSSPKAGLNHSVEFLKLKYSAQDIRYTAAKNGKTVYAITLGAPQPGEPICLNGFAKQIDQIKNVRLLNGQKLDWKKDGTTLRVTAPATDETLALAVAVELQ
ncbi:MAG TPA: alpha-L-fucosidase [Pontiellaceae bacterium]|nr:alpha-L-fucosidase [Pontiellaceae bacterium]